MTATLDTTLGAIVAEDFRAAAVFQKHGVDFCCHGSRTLEQACRAADLDGAALLEEIQEASAAPAAGLPRFNDWDLPALASYIVANHHAYVRQALPLMVAHSRKIAQVHGARHRELARVAQLVEDVAEEMTAHMMKEEQILFPYIAELARRAAAGQPAPFAPFGTVDNPIHMMEAEHESAGAAMLEIRELTDGYRVPDDACATYAVCLQELEAFERDLHAHVHLENNILFPKASAVEAHRA
jgi:regulator of cell morphogenesis and NO signaling